MPGAQFRFQDRGSVIGVTSIKTHIRPFEISLRRRSCSQTGPSSSHPSLARSILVENAIVKFYQAACYHRNGCRRPNSVLDRKKLALQGEFLLDIILAALRIC